MGRDGKARKQMKRVRKRYGENTKRFSRKWENEGIRREEGIAPDPHAAHTVTKL